MGRRGQSILEYIILFIIIIAALITMQIYMKRGFQGRWKTAVDDLGEQYDPRTSNGVITYKTLSNSTSEVRAVPATVNGQAGFYTMRYDTTTSEETKNGFLQTGY